jgi:predicted metal-dependent hydrolase
MTVAGDPHALDPIQEAIRLFNDRYFFEAHEVLEEVWRQEHGEPRAFLQGLIQICAAYHHSQNGNFVGAVTLLERGAEKMRRYPAGYLGIETEPFLSRVNADRIRLKEMADGGTPSAIDFPQIERKVQK